MSASTQDLAQSSATAAASESEVLETSIQIELVGALVRQSRDAALIAPVGMLFLAWVQFGHAPLATMIAWLMVIALPDTLTLATSLQFSSAPKTLESMRFWQVRQTLFHTLAGLAWGSSVVFFVDIDTAPSQEMKTVLILMVISALAVIPLSTSMLSLIGFEIGISLIPLLHYLFSPHPEHGWLAAGTVLLMGCTLHFGWIAHRLLRAHVRSSTINDRLATALSEANLTINETNRELQEKNNALTHALEKLNNQATHDELTGLYNRRYILQRLETELQDSRRYRTACSIALIDIDFFKQVNDRYGHNIGDLVLRGFADRIQGELRQGDVFARYGGEEFLLVLPMTELGDAVKLVDRLRQLVEDSPVIVEPVAITIQSSFGVAQLHPSEPVHDCIARADEALYRAKANGRNRVELAEKIQA
jgi:diguanylate cyclase (GGDEF)-like protein